jgi:hypothetical protein
MMSDLLAVPLRDDASEPAPASAALDTTPQAPGDAVRGDTARTDAPPIPTAVPAAVVRPLTRQGRRLRLDTLPVPVASAPSIASLRFDATSKNGVHHTVDLTGLPGSALTQALARALRSWLTRLRVDVDKGAWAVRQLHRLADALGPAAATLSPKTLTPALLEAFVASEKRRGRNWREDVRVTFSVLKEVGALAYERETWQRLQRIDPHQPRARAGDTSGRTAPREAYAKQVDRAMRAACRADIDAALARFTEEVPALVAAGRDPRPLGPDAWGIRANAAWAAYHLGPRNKAEWCALIGISDYEYNRRYLNSDAECTPYEAQCQLYPSVVDLLPFFLLFLLTSGVPLANALRLPVGCMEKVADGRFTLSYLKHRANHKLIPVRLRDGSLTTPGGIIRAVLALTAPLRQHSPSDYLWWCLAGRNSKDMRAGQMGRVPSFVPGRAVMAGITAPVVINLDLLPEWVARHDLRDEDGAPLDLQASRLRKNYKVEVTRATGGALGALTDDHTAVVHIGRYAKVRAAVKVHNKLAYEAMKGMRPTTVKSVVLTPEEEQQALADPTALAARTRKPLPVIANALVSNDVDVFFAKCTGFTESPFAPKGTPCPASPTGQCLDCDNALIPPSKLPVIIAFVNHLLRQRPLMSAEEWEATYGAAYTKIVFGILMTYPAKLLREARVLAESHHGELLFLGPALQPWAHL